MNNTTTDTASINMIIFMHEQNFEKYHSALREFPNIEGDVKAIFERIVEESVQCRNKLTSKDEKEKTEKIFQFNEADIKEGKKKLFSQCLDDIGVILDFYPLVLSSEVTDKELRSILSAQQDSLENLYNHIKEFHDAQ